MAISLSVVGSILISVSIVYLTVKLAQTLAKFRRLTRVLKQIPCDETHWLWGHLKELPGPKDVLVWHRQHVKKYPRMSIVWFGPFIGLVVVSHPDTIRPILRTSDPKGEQAHKLMRPWVGDGLLLSKGHKWLRNRRLLTPAFHFDILKPYMVVNNQAADVFLSKVKNHSENAEYFDVFRDVKLYTLDVILRCACSYNTDCQYLGEQHPYVKAVTELASLAINRFTKPWFYNDFLYSLTPKGRRFHKACKIVHHVSSDIIQKRKSELANSSPQGEDRKRYLDFLDILLTARDEEGAGLTDTEIRDEVDTFLFAGHDTTASALCWTLYSLAGNPEHQTLVHQEVEELLKGRDSQEILWSVSEEAEDLPEREEFKSSASNESPGIRRLQMLLWPSWNPSNVICTSDSMSLSKDDLPKLTYLTMCIKEALRLYTPAPFLLRQLTQPLTIDDVTLPVDTLVNIATYDVHHNPEVWEDPMEYRPERFSRENVDSRDPYSFVPFSAGPRNCIGQNFAMHEIKVLIARLIHRFSLVVDPSRKPEENVEIVVRSKNGVWIKAVPRPCWD